MTTSPLRAFAPRSELAALAASQTFKGYEAAAAMTANYAEAGTGSITALTYVVLGLAGEAGEVADAFKKILRDDASVLTEAKRDQIIAELGDVCWYIARLCDELDIPMAEVCRRNTTKLADRQQRNVLGGSGDNR